MDTTRQTTQKDTDALYYRHCFAVQLSVNNDALISMDFLFVPSCRSLAPLSLSSLFLSFSLSFSFSLFPYFVFPVISFYLFSMLTDASRCWTNAPPWCELPCLRQSVYGPYDLECFCVWYVLICLRVFCLHDRRCVVVSCSSSMSMLPYSSPFSLITKTKGKTIRKAKKNL